MYGLKLKISWHGITDFILQTTPVYAKAVRGFCHRKYYKSCNGVLAQQQGCQGSSSGPVHSSDSSGLHPPPPPPGHCTVSPSCSPHSVESLGSPWCCACWVLVPFCSAPTPSTPWRAELFITLFSLAFFFSIRDFRHRFRHCFKVQDFHFAQTIQNKLSQVRLSSDRCSF